MSEQISENCAAAAIKLDKPSAYIHTSMVDVLAALQHRGQEAAGIAYVIKRGIHVKKDVGLVRKVFTPSKLAEYPHAQSEIGHTRYSTAGKKTKRNAQPFGFNNFAIEQNGNIPQDFPHENGQPDSDTYGVGNLISQYPEFERGVTEVLPTLKGAYTFVFLDNLGNTYVARDPHGMRPAVYGQINLQDSSGVIVASETGGLTAVNSKFAGEVPRGTFSKIHPNKGLEILWTDPRVNELPHDGACTFERAYFANAPSSFIREGIEDVSNHTIRVELGKSIYLRMSREGLFSHHRKDYVVVPVPASGYSYAQGVAEESGFPIVYGIQQWRYSGRSFITPGTSEERKAAVKQKYTFIPEEIKGKRVIMVDDSSVRGFTDSGIVLNLLEHGAEEVLVAIGIPPIIERCFWGTDFGTYEELIFFQLMKEFQSSDPANYETLKEFERRFAEWLINGNERFKGKVNVMFQLLPNYKRIINGDFRQDITGSSETPGCYHCVEGILLHGLIYPPEQA